jgi:hypothetical protein
MRASENQCSITRTTSMNERRVKSQSPISPRKRLLIVAVCLWSSLAANAELRFKEIRTASKEVLVAYFKSTGINANEVNTANLASWKLNGQPVTAINKFGNCSGLTGSPRWSARD